LSLLHNIANRGQEDIATEVVVYLLKLKDKHVPFQRLFFNLVVKCTKSSSELEVETITQAKYDESGKPDFCILTTDALIIGETKLGSYLSGDDQLIRYSEILTNEKSLMKNFFSGAKHVKRKILIFLAPRKILPPSMKACDQVSQAKYGMAFLSFLEEKKIEFVFFPWEELISFLDIENPIQRELYLLAESFINQELNKEEKMVLGNKDVPNGMSKLVKIIDEFKTNLHSLDFKDGRMGQSWNFYGFFIIGKNLKCWFGYLFPIWAEYNTPIFLQIQENWITAEKDEIIDKLRNEGFMLNKTQGYVKPFELNSDIRWKQDLVEILNRILGGRG